MIPEFFLTLNSQTPGNPGVDTGCWSNVNFSWVELGDTAVSGGDPLLAAISSANGSGRHLPLSRTNLSSQGVEPTLTLRLAPISPQLSLLPGSSRRDEGMLGEDLCFPHTDSEGSLTDLLCSPIPQTYFLP